MVLVVWHQIRRVRQVKFGMDLLVIRLHKTAKVDKHGMDQLVLVFAPLAKPGMVLLA